MNFPGSVSASASTPCSSHGSSLPAAPPASRLPSPVSRHGRSAAFTLVELLIGATLSAAVLAAVLSSYLFLSRQLTRLAHQQTLETQARRAIGYFTQDVQRATGLTDTGNLGAGRVSLTVPSGTATQTVTYYYNASLTNSATVSVNGTNVTMPAASLTRCVYDGTTVTSLTLLRYITDGDALTNDNDLLFRYYDSSGNEYTSYTNYLPGIKQLALEFVTQTGTAASGTQTPLNRTTSSRLVLRNRGFLQ